VTDAVRRTVVAVVVVAGIFGVLAATAAAHGGGSSEYRSRVEKITPVGLPISAVVVDNDDRLRITNAGDGELTVYAYADEPYVRIGPDGVFVNENTPAFYNNQERYGGADVPEGVGEGEPKWVRQDGDEATYEFHDHRIHWMLPSPPKQVDLDDPARQRVLEWSVPISYDGTAGTIEGTLDYVGGSAPETARTTIIAGVAGAVVVLVGGAVLLVRRRRRRARSTEG
jgi:LPXTG-motif cell wall-anchored protein